MEDERVAMQTSAKPTSAQLQAVVTTEVMAETPTVRRVVLRPAVGDRLKPFSAGAHIDLHLPNGIVRSYSILNDPRENDRYVVAVQREPDSRGGSEWMHSQLHQGSDLQVSQPRNNFMLNEGVDHSIFVAGGIGITPFLSMIHRLNRLGQRWTLHYATRTRDIAAFLVELRELESHGMGTVRLYFDHEPGGQALDLSDIAASAEDGDHVYCCGPAGLLDAFEAAMRPRSEETVHLERFNNDLSDAGGDEFAVVLASSGDEFLVPEDKSILDVLLDAGIEIPCSCLEGTCGSCATGLLQGVADHRDVVLTPAEQQANDQIMVCCSRARSPRLVLDL